jgi:hypothetical protein
MRVQGTKKYHYLFIPGSFPIPLARNDPLIEIPLPLAANYESK